MSWPRWTENPPISEVVRVVAMAHLTAFESSNDFDPLPGGLFAAVVPSDSHSGHSARRGLEGHLVVLSMPRSAVGMGQYDEYAWREPFPYNLGADRSANGMRFERVPTEIQDAVRAAVALYGDDHLPMPVDDGWLC